MSVSRRDFLKGAGALTAAPLLAELAGRCEATEVLKRPNILFFFPDQHRFDWVGPTPEIPVRTPHLDALSARGVRFTRAFCPSPLCAPSRACLAACREYDRCGVSGNDVDYPLSQKSIYASLRDAGYHVMACGKLDLSKRSGDWGIRGDRHLAEWGYSDGINSAGKWDAFSSGKVEPQDPYMAFLHKEGLAEMHLADYKRRRENQFTTTFPTPLPEAAYGDNWVADNGLDLLARAPTGKPWFLMVNFPGPHPPMDITRKMDALYSAVDFPQPNGNDRYAPEVHVAIRRNYSAMIENIDRLLGVYLEELGKRGELEKTLVVFSSDHGEMLGDHNLWGKTKPYQPSVGVPLTVAGPDVARGTTLRAPVSLIDLAATFVEFGGAEPPPESEGRSLAPLLRGDTEKHREVVFSGLHGWREAFDGRYKLILGYDEEGPLLFDLDEDPLENRNLASAAPNEVRRLTEAIREGLGFG